jgi:hypothetical protein
VIQDERTLLKPIDYEVMARIYEWQALAADPNMDPQYRAHYRRRILAVSEELNAILAELDRVEVSIAKEEAFLANQA